MKRLFNIMLLLIFLVSLISFSVNAAPRDILRAGLTPIENFFTGGWQNYEKTITFVIFFFLFFSAYLIGMKKAMGGELTRAHTVFAFTAAFLSSFIISITLRFDWVNLEYVAWFLIAVLILFLIHTLLLKIGLEKHKFLAFILALILTALLLWLIWYLMNEGRPLEGLGKVNDWFKDMTRRAKLGKEARPGKPIEEKVKIVEKVTERGGFWKWLAIALIIGFVSWGVKKGRDLIRVRRGRRIESTVTPEQARPALTIPTEGKLEDVKAIKIEILSKIEGVMSKIKGNEKEIVWIYKKYLENMKRKGTVVWEKGILKAIKKDDKNVKELIKEQQELEQSLITLSHAEKALFGKIDGLKKAEGLNIRHYNELLDRLKNEISEVLKNVLVYYRFAAGEVNIGNQLEELFNKNRLEKMMQDKWLELVKIKTTDLEKYFEEEKNGLRLLENNIKIENLTIDGIEKLSKQKIEIVHPNENEIQQPFILGEPIELEASIEGFEGQIMVMWRIVGADGRTQQLGDDLKFSPRIDISLPEGNAILELSVYENMREITPPITKNIVLERNKVKIASELLNKKEISGGSNVSDIHQALDELNIR